MAAIVGYLQNTITALTEQTRKLSPDGRRPNCVTGQDRVDSG